MQRVFETGVAALLPSGEDSFPDAAARAEGLRAACHVPLFSRNKVLGVLSVGRREEILFTHDDLQLLTEIGIQVAIAVHNALAYREIGAIVARNRLPRERNSQRAQLRRDHRQKRSVAAGASATRNGCAD